MKKHNRMLLLISIGSFLSIIPVTQVIKADSTPYLKPVSLSSQPKLVIRDATTGVIIRVVELIGDKAQQEKQRNELIAYYGQPNAIPTNIQQQNNSSDKKNVSGDLNITTGGVNIGNGKANITSPSISGGISGSYEQNNSTQNNVTSKVGTPRQYTFIDLKPGEGQITIKSTPDKVELIANSQAGKHAVGNVKAVSQDPINNPINPNVFQGKGSSTVVVYDDQNNKEAIAKGINTPEKNARIYTSPSLGQQFKNVYNKVVVEPSKKIAQEVARKQQLASIGKSVGNGAQKIGQRTSTAGKSSQPKSTTPKSSGSGKKR